MNTMMRVKPFGNPPPTYRLFSPQGVAVWDVQRLFDGTGRYACYVLSRRPVCPFFECFAVVDDFGNLQTI